MDRARPRDQLRETPVGSNGVRNSVRYESSSSSSPGSRGIKREMLDGHQYGIASSIKLEPELESPPDVITCVDWVNNFSIHLQHVDVKDDGRPCISPEAEAGAWLRDEPMDVGSICSGSRTSETTKAGGSQSLSDSTGSAGLVGLDIAEDSSAPQLKGPSTSSLLAELRAIKIKESVIRDTIQRFGGGQKGLVSMIRVIMFWLREKHRASSQSSDLSAARGDSQSPLEECDQRPWCNANSGGSGVDVQFGSFINNCNPIFPGEVSCAGNKSILGGGFGDGGGSFCDLRIGGSSSSRNSSGDYGDVPYHRENEMLIGEQPATFGGLLDGGLLGPGVHGSGKAVLKDFSSMPSGCRGPSGRSSEGIHRAAIGKFPPSPESSSSGRHFEGAYDDSHCHRNKIRRLSPSLGSNNFSSQGSGELPTYGASAGSPPVSEGLSGTPPSIFGSVGANPFAPGGPFSLSPSSPPHMDPHSLDAGPFTPFGMQSSILMDESLSLGGVQGCGLIDRLGSMNTMYPVSSENALVDREHSGPLLGLLGKPMATPAASTRLARKNRMDRNRKAAAHHGSRSSPQTAGVFSGPMCSFSSSGSMRRPTHSQGLLTSEGLRPSRDRRDQEHLQFLLQKVLKPSDVGNLGRIVLPKKDAETHLPWLGAREGVQFACEDYDTGEKMILRYRFWPNNKSRMYLLENTGDFVKKHHLQESDRLLIYRNQQQGTFIIRARRARDCLDVSLCRGQSAEIEGDVKEVVQQCSPGSPSSSRSSSFDRNVEPSEVVVGSSLKTDSDRVVTGVAAAVTTQGELLNFADLPDAPMGDVTDNLVRFPSLESFDVELLELAPIPVDRQEVRSG